MKTGREQLALYLVLILALTVGAYILGSEIRSAGLSNAQQLEEATR